MASDVYFADIRSRGENENKLEKIRRLFSAAGFDRILDRGDLTAIKLHFGEVGNDTYISPVFVREVVKLVKERGARPFLTDTNTLYSGGRGNSVDHTRTAIEHGFAYAVVDAPVIIADGLRGGNHVSVDVNLNHFRSVRIAGDIASAESMIVLSHFKAHILAGFGGAIKNLGMGCAPPIGKAEQHTAKPIVHREKCRGCGRCVKACPRTAISVSEGKAIIDISICVGCGECVRACQERAMDFDWAVAIPPFVERMVEYAYGAVKGKVGRVGFFNFLIDVTPDCDCVPWSDAPVVPDIGILASRDPVAIDMASYDLVNAQMGLENSYLKGNRMPGEDKFRGCWESTNALHQIVYGEKIGLGTAKYNLIRI